MDGEMNVSHGDSDTIPQGEKYFPSEFKIYMRKEQLKWSHVVSENRWVFWSQPDDKITRALQKWVDLDGLWRSNCLVQFWAAPKTLEGRTRLTTQSQPFAFSHSYATGRRLLCDYRMMMCSSEYDNCFYADAESGEEQLGLPDRVFRNQFPEFIPRVEYYTTKEYPQRNLALRCHIGGSWAVPVFENSNRTCVGVLEMVSRYTLGNDEWPNKFFPNNVNKIFQELGLQCFNGYPACEEEVSDPACEEESREKGKRVKGLAQALEELKMVLSSVCKTHKLPLAMTWVPCSACKGLRRCEVSSTDVEDHHLDEFLKASKHSHLRKGLVAGRACSSPTMLYCSDISQLSLYDYPLVPYARLCKLSGWFTISLLCKHTGNFIYVLEFFLSARSKDDEETTLSYILGTIEEKFTTFRFASGKELGELMSLEVIHFQNNQKTQFVRSIQATRDFSKSSIQSSVQSSPSVANKRPRFQDANMVTSKAKCVPNSDSDSDPSFEQSSTSVANTRPGF